MNYKQIGTTMNTHLQRAKDYIAIAESSDSKREAYIKAADEIIAAQKEDPTLGQRELAKQLGRVQSYVSDLVRWRTSDRAHDQLPFARDEKDTHEIRQQRDAHKVLSEAEPETIREIVRELPRKQRERLSEAAHQATMDEIHAKQAEHRTEPTVRDLMGNDPFDPSESWADNEIIRVQDKAYVLYHQVKKWGLVLGSLSEDEAYEMLQEAEHNVAEVRVVLQERIADRSRAEA